MTSMQMPPKNKFIIPWLLVDQSESNQAMAYQKLVVGWLQMSKIIMSINLFSILANSDQLSKRNW